MKYFAYFLNLALFSSFIYAIIEASENPSPLVLAMLVMSTIGLASMFVNHCYCYKE